MISLLGLNLLYIMSNRFSPSRYLSGKNAQQTAGFRSAKACSKNLSANLYGGLVTIAKSEPAAPNVLISKKSATSSSLYFR